MPIDYSLEVRKAVVKHLINDEDVTALVSRERIYGEESPAKPVWPFIRMGFVLPRRSRPKAGKDPSIG